MTNAAFDCIAEEHRISFDDGMPDAGIPERRLLDDFRGLSSDELALALLSRRGADASPAEPDGSRPDARTAL